jgi:hypothetical protein
MLCGDLFATMWSDGHMVKGHGFEGSSFVLLSFCSCELHMTKMNDIAMIRK